MIMGEYGTGPVDKTRAGRKPWLYNVTISHHCRQTVIHFCAAQNFVEFLQDLAELGASVDLADNRGEYSHHM